MQIDKQAKFDTEIGTKRFVDRIKALLEVNSNDGEATIQEAIAELKTYPAQLFRDILGIDLPENPTDEHYVAILNAVDLAVPKNSNLTGIEVSIQDDGLWVRHCGGEACDEKKIAEYLAQQLLLEDRVTTSFCRACHIELYGEIGLPKEQVRKRISSMQLPAVVLEKKSN